MNTFDHCYFVESQLLYLWDAVAAWLLEEDSENSPTVELVPGRVFGDDVP